jgi:hypothetical protein
MQAVKDGLAAAPLSFAPTQPLLSWQRMLIAADSDPVADELPEVVVESELQAEELARLLPLALALTDSEWALARECELRATAARISLQAQLRALLHEV